MRFLLHNLRQPFCQVSIELRSKLLGWSDHYVTNDFLSCDGRRKQLLWTAIKSTGRRHSRKARSSPIVAVGKKNTQQLWWFYIKMRTKSSNKDFGGVEDTDKCYRDCVTSNTKSQSQAVATWFNIKVLSSSSISYLYYAFPFKMSLEVLYTNWQVKWIYLF